MTLKWKSAPCAEDYHLQVSTDSNFRSSIVQDLKLVAPLRKIGPLAKEKSYYWRVNASDNSGISNYSATWRFSTSPESTYLLPISSGWNLVSTPVKGRNEAKEFLFPTSNSKAFIYNRSAYAVEETLFRHNGYWLKFSGSDTVGIAG